jgi:hypothetical protein
MLIGEILVLKHDVGLGKYARNHYQFKDGPFSIYDQAGQEMKFNGQHFECIGSDYFHGTKGHICGLDLFDSEFEVLLTAPDNLIP